MPRARRLTALAAALAMLLAYGAQARAAAAAPVLARLSPSGVAPGGTLTLYGSAFGNPGPGAAVYFFGPDVSAPALAAQVLLWQPDAIRVRAPATGIWPGIADVEVVNPAAASLPSGALPVRVTNGGTGVVAAETSWLPSGSGGAGSLRAGWSDADGAPPAPILLTLPTTTPGGAAAFTVPASIPAAAVTVDGTPAADVTVTDGTMAWPGGGTAGAATLRITPAAGSAPVPGQLVVDLTPPAGVLAPAASATLPLIIGPAGATAAADVSIGASGVAGFQVGAPAQVPAGSPFTVTIRAVTPTGTPVSTDSGPVYLSSSGDVDFLTAQPTATGPTSAEVTLRGGSADVTAVAQVAGPVTLRVTDGAGFTGSAAVTVSAPQAGAGVSLQVFPPFSGYQGTPTDFTVASVRSLDRRSGAAGATGGTTAVYGGFWPDGVGTGYEAQWTGTITVLPPPALPSPLPQPTLTFAFLNEAAQNGGATLTPVAGSGATVNGQTAGVDLATASPAAGWAVPTEVALTPGRYTLTVQASEDNPSADAGDTLYYSEAFTPAAAAAQTAAAGNAPAPGPEWSPLTPVPPAAFTPAGLPDPALSVPVGAGTADDAGAPVQLSQPALIENSSTLLPLRAIAETLGAQVEWHPATQGITVSGPGGAPPVTQLTIGSTSATVNGVAVTLPQAPLLLPPGVTMVPLRFLGQALGWQVAWNNATRTAVLLPPLLAALPLRP